MALNSAFVVATDLCEVFVDKDTGQPLAGGYIKFFRDISPTTPKLVYTLNNNIADYEYVVLPNQLYLSSVGTPIDDNGNNVAIYYYPYLGDPSLNSTTIDLYFIQVYNSFGVLQFTRQAWPNITAQDSPVTIPQTSVYNQLDNAQFVDISFPLNNPLTIPYTSAGTIVAVAPNWNLVVTASGSGNVILQRTSVRGTAQLPGNPPYTITVSPGSNMLTCQLVQTLYNNPDVFSPITGAGNGWIATSILLTNNSSINILYQPNDTGLASAQTILSQNNISGFAQQYSATVQLTTASNNTTSDTGYVNIVLKFPTNQATTFANVQVVGLESNISVGYEQVTANRQKDLLFNYYNPLLQKMPNPSYLVGWDFPLNPTQFLGPTVPADTFGANQSKYIWDQTIIFQTTNSGIGATRASSGALRLTAALATQMAVIQYLPQADARMILNDAIAVNVSALASAPVTATISLWYTTGATLPSTVASNLSLVAGLDMVSGKPTSFNQAGGVAWTEVPRNGLGDATFTIGTSSTTNFNDYAFSGWNLNGIAACNTATWFAIVVGTGPVALNGTIDINSISACRGSIATRPAPKPFSDVLSECQHFYQKSFNVGTVPAANLGLGTGEYYGMQGNITGISSLYYLINVPFKGSMIAAPSTVTIYNPAASNAQIRDVSSAGSDFSGSVVVNKSQNGCVLAATGVGSTGDSCTAHWAADARLGQ